MKKIILETNIFVQLIRGNLQILKFCQKKPPNIKINFIQMQADFVTHNLVSKIIC